MRKIVFISMLVVIATSILSQQASTVSTDYLQKAKNQKTVAWVFLGAGSVLFMDGLTMKINYSATIDKKLRNRNLLTGVGGLLVACSVPLFIIAAGNKRKAMASSTFLKMETIPVIQNTSFASLSYPALSIKINL